MKVIKYTIRMKQLGYLLSHAPWTHDKVEITKQIDKQTEVLIEWAAAESDRLKREDPAKASEISRYIKKAFDSVWLLKTIQINPN
jgi:hypothetical protein